MPSKNYRFAYFCKKIGLSNTRQVTTKKILSTICAIFFALLFATSIAFLVSFTQWKPEEYAQNYFKIWETIGTHWLALGATSIEDKMTTINVVIQFMGIFVTSGLAFIVAFKAGLFNIGVSGQMFAGAVAATFVGHKLSINGPGLNQLVMLVVSILTAALVAMAIGTMKVLLNVNEVVSSIMLNWFLYFIGVMLLGQYMPTDASGLNTSSLSLDKTFCLDPNNPNSAYIVVLIMIAICVILVSIFLKFTVMGKKQVATGLSNSASIANGYNVKANVIGAMAISGALAGILGCLVYCCYKTQMPVTAVAKAIPQEGFNGIAVGLIAMNNPVACVPVAFLFAIVQESSRGLNGIGIDPNVPMVVFGIVVYGSAAIALFMNMKPCWLAVKIFRGKNYSVVKHNHKLTKTILMDISNEQIMLLNKNYSSYLRLTKFKGTLKASLASKMQGWFATFRNKVCYWWLSKVKKLPEEKLRQHQHLNKLQNLRIHHTSRIALIKTNVIQKEAYEKTTKWFHDEFNLCAICTPWQLNIVKQAFYAAFFTTSKQIKEFYCQAYKTLSHDRRYPLNKLNIRFNEDLIPKTYFKNVKKELRQFNLFGKSSHYSKTKRLVPNGPSGKVSQLFA